MGVGGVGQVTDRDLSDGGSRVHMPGVLLVDGGGQQ